LIRVPRSTIDWLLEPSNAVIRAITFERVLRRRTDDPELRDARAAIASSPWVGQVMRGQHADGWWVNPKSCYQPRGEATVWHLQLLAELGAAGDDPRIVTACERFLRQHGMPDGGFACGMHSKRYSEECLTGHMLYTLAAFGRGREARSLAARDWLLERQLADGGWNCTPHRAHSSFVSTLGPMKALALLTDADSARAVRRAVEFLLAHRIFFSHVTGRPVRRFWPPVIQFPAHYAYDLLHPLRTLVIARAKVDERLADALDLLEARADAAARWSTDAAPRAMMIERPGRPGKWATAAALGVLAHFGRLTHDEVRDGEREERPRRARAAAGSRGGVGARRSVPRTSRPRAGGARAAKRSGVRARRSR
jgi:hypothetical protein